MSRSSPPRHPAPKICASCGRAFDWRRKWADCWEEVRHCSASCRRRGVNSQDRRLEQTILDLLVRREPGKTICPSEAARAIAPAEESWRPLLEPVRRAARRLARQGRVEILQRGRPVDPDEIRGPIRLRARRAGEPSAAP